MDFSYVPSLEKRKKADLIIIPFWKTQKGPQRAADVGRLKSEVFLPIDAGDFKGDMGKTALVYLHGRKEKRAILLGLGEKNKVTVETFRRAFAEAVKVCHAKKVTKINVLIPICDKCDQNEIARGVGEGMLLINYSFEDLKGDTDGDDLKVLVEKVYFIGVGKRFVAIVKKAEQISKGVFVARNLVNGNADDVTPEYLARIAYDCSKTLPAVTTRILKKKDIEKEGMGLLLAVSRGSMNDPSFIMMNYDGAPDKKERVVVIGKGVTFDSGGLNLKPTGHLKMMKTDMAGAATVIGIIIAAAHCGLKANICGVIPAAENGIDAKSYKTGDVYRSYSGKMVEVINTDAEGRLLLADALAYSCKKLAPSYIIDLATLTGAMLVSLGDEVVGYMSNDDELSKQIDASGASTFERVWRLPLYEEFKEPLQSDIADIKNVSGRQPSSIAAAIFLQEFVGEGIPWAHFDIAGTAYFEKEKRYLPKYGSGWGVRLVIDLLERL